MTSNRVKSALTVSLAADGATFVNNVNAQLDARTTVLRSVQFDSSDKTATIDAAFVILTEATSFEQWIIDQASQATGLTTFHECPHAQSEPERTWYNCRSHSSYRETRT